MQPPAQTNPITQVTQNVTKSYNKDKKSFVIMASLFVVVIVAGIITGKVLAGGKVGGTAPTGNSAPGAKTSLTEAGISDESTFKDTAEGTLREGGIEGDGTHHLERDGGPSQNVYLTSTVIDLQSFVGKKVQIWGQTLSAKKAGWLMDVGKIKVK